MAQTKVDVEIQIGNGPAIKSMGDLKKQLKEANFEALALSEKFGASSKEAIEAAKRVAQLKDAIGDAKAFTDAFNPDAKFKAFGAAIQGVVGGFSALQGAQALFGSESEDVAKVLAKVQGALALSQGIDSILEAKDSFKNLNAVIQASTAFQKANAAANRVTAATMKLFGASVESTAVSFRVLKTALISTGIGAIVVLIGEAIAAFQEYTSAADNAAEAQKEFNEQALKYADIGLKTEQATLARQEKIDIAKAKLAGKTEQEIFQIEQDYRERKGKSLVRYYDEIKDIDKNKGAEVIGQIKDLNAEGQVAELNNQIKLKEIKDQAAKADKQKREQESKDRLKQIEDANKAEQDKIRSLQEKNYLESIQDERKRQEQTLILEFENERKRINNSIANKDIKNKELQLLEQNYQIQLDSLRQGFADEDQKKRNEENQKRIDANNAARKKQNEDEAKSAQERIEILKAENAAKEGLQNAYFDVVGAGIGIIKQFGEKSKALQKAALIAENAITIARIILDTQKANAAVTAKYALLPGGQVPASIEILTNKIKAGIGIATAIAATAKGLQAIGGGGASASSGGNNLGGGGSSAAPAPISATASSTALQQAQINQLSSATTRAFVLESDVSGNQERIQRLNRAARIN